MLRFGGVEFLDFLHSLDDLPGRCRLAVPDLDMPQLELEESGSGRCVLTVRGPWPQYGPVMVGVLRAMADDYGALVLLEVISPARDGAARIAIDLFDPCHTPGRQFDLSAGG
ncbi:heme NO-binding domain-containing protein [Rhodobaculum claviforme]|uniref:heme NO-binding domain-containing protein n=1 Tax=Rhodobaculum claviforme TaxID=1549854 RepID=UPI001F5C8152|nr:heme NO-binding domain-containing protein [Rhodobaculum claviforme]